MTSDRYVASIQAEIEALLATRARLRENGARPAELEANRIELADHHRTLARAMVDAWKSGVPIPKPAGRAKVGTA